MNNKNFENIQIPQEIDLAIREGIKQGSNQKIKKRNNLIKLVTCASITGFIFISRIDSGIADRIPFISDVFKEIKNSNKYEVITLNINEYFKDYSQSINQTVKKNGISVTIEDVISDGKSIVVSYIIKNDKSFIIDETGSQILSTENATININGVNYQLDNINSIEGVYTDNYTFVGIQKFGIKAIESVPVKFNMNIEFTSIDRVVGEPWNFEFAVNVSDDINKVIDVSKTKSNFTLNSVEINLLNTKIDYILPKETENTAYEIVVKDDKGNYIDKNRGEFLEVEDTTYEREIAEFKSINKNCKYIDVIFKELEKVPNPKAPGYILLEKDNLEDTIFRININ